MTTALAGAASVPLGIPDWPHTTDGTPLLARCLLLSDGETSFCLLSLCVLALTSEDSARVRSAVSLATGLWPEQVMVACTHVHSGPPVLSDVPETRSALVPHLCAAAAEAASRAREQLCPTCLGYSADSLPGISRVRRIRRRNGTIVTIRRAWPQGWGWARDPETVGPEEPLDDLLTVLRVDDQAGNLLATVVHFTCHPLPDFVGWAARMVEAQHSEAVCLMLNGCLGNVGTPFEVPMRGRTHADQLPVLGDILAYRCLELLARTATRPEASVAVASQPVFLPADPTFLSRPGDRAGLWPEALSAGGFAAEVQTATLGDLALVGIPGEINVGFGVEVERSSPFGLARVVGLCNGYVGYLLPESSRSRGSYEADPTQWGVVGGEGVPRLLHAVRESLRLLSR